MHVVLMAGIAQFHLVHIPPFVDGNGRTSRLLSILVLYRAGYDFKRLFTISEYYDHDRSAFYTALQSVREDDLDLTGWLEYFVMGLTIQLAEVTDRGKRTIRIDIIGQQYKLNVRQQDALRFLLTEPLMTIQDFVQICPSVTRRTLQRDLRDLVAKGLLAEAGGAETDPNRSYGIKSGL